MDLFYIIAQAVGLLAMAFNILSYQQKTRERAIAFQLCGGGLFAVNFLLLGATTLSFRLTDAKAIRRYGLISSPSWLIYNICCFSLGAIVCEVLSLFSIGIGMFRLDRQKDAPSN